MEVKLESLIPYEQIKNDAGAVLNLVEKNGRVVLIKDNLPAYIIMKFDPLLEPIEKEVAQKFPKYKLHEAMKIVLLEAENNTMHAAALADEIFKRNLYLQKNGLKAKYNQIRARCGHYPAMFETLPGNMIKLKAVAGEHPEL